jgi:DNA (cytosine-5)-methyltransferase 1
MEGGFSFAGKQYEKTSFETVFACDINPFAKKVYDNYAEKTGRRCRLTLASIVDIVTKTPESLPKADVLTGGFPCQDFSLAGKRQGFSSSKNHLGEHGSGEKRGTLYSWMCQAVGIVNPKLIIAENVKGLLTMPGALTTIRGDFSAMGYTVKSMLLNAASYGVPQKRERVIIVGLRNDILKASALESLESWPPSGVSLVPSTVPEVHCIDVLADSFEPSSENEDRDSYSKCAWLPQGQGQTEIDLYGFAPTIRSEHHGNIEYRALARERGGRNPGPERRLSIRECARLQSFPDTYEFVPVIKSMSEAYKLIGNAVPPVLGWHLAKNFEKNWDLLFDKDALGG